MAILVTDGVGEGNLGMVTSFCFHDKAKIEASDAHSTLCQHDSLEPGVVVVRRYTNTSYIPHGSSHFLYLDVSTLSRVASSVQFPLGQLCLCRLLPYSDIEEVLSWEEGKVGLKVFPYFQKVLWQSLEEEHCLSNLISLSVPLSASPSRKEHPDEGRIRLSPSPQMLAK